MTPISNQHFALVCFLVLMQNGEGIMSKAPSYIAEKQRVMGAGEDAFAHLDHNNQAKVIRWCEEWKVELPENVRKYWEEFLKEFGHEV